MVVSPPPCSALQGGVEGRLHSYNPYSGITQVLADNIWQANGVAVSHDETFVVVVSTASMRLYRYWLKGSKVAYAFLHDCLSSLGKTFQLKSCQAVYVQKAAHAQRCIKGACACSICRLLCCKALHQTLLHAALKQSRRHLDNKHVCGRGTSCCTFCIITTYQRGCDWCCHKCRQPDHKPGSAHSRSAHAASD